MKLAKKGKIERPAEKSNVPATLASVAPGEGEVIVNAGNKQFKVSRIVTLPLLKHADGMVCMIQITRAIYVGKEMPVEKGSANAASKPADLVDVIDLNTGRKMQYIVSAVVKSTLENTYPDASYVGLSFAIRKGEKREGKRYREYEIVQIEAVESEAA